MTTASITDTQGRNFSGRCSVPRRGNPGSLGDGVRGREIGVCRLLAFVVPVAVVLGVA